MTIATIHKLMVWDSRRISVLLLLSAMLVCGVGCEPQLASFKKPSHAVARPSAAQAAQTLGNGPRDTDSTQWTKESSIQTNIIAGDVDEYLKTLQAHMRSFGRGNVQGSNETMELAMCFGAMSDNNLMRFGMRSTDPQLRAMALTNLYMRTTNETLKT